MRGAIRYAIIGNSAAGIAAARAIRARDREGRIAVFSDEPYPFYSRLLLTYFLKGTTSRERLFGEGESRGEAGTFETKLNTLVEAILPAEGRIVSSSGESFPYDRLLVASGSSPVVPPIPGSRLPGVLPLRTLHHADEIMGRIRPGGQAVILGGGLVGLQTAQALHARGMKTTLIVSSGRLLSRNLDERGSDLLFKEAEEAGLKVLFHQDAGEIAKGRGGELRVLLKGGEALKADLVILAKGVEPLTGLLKEAGAAVREGVLVSGRLRTSLENIFAAGDVAEITAEPEDRGEVFPIWPNAVEQGGIAGMNMAGLDVPFQRGIPMNITELFGVKIASIGRFRNDGSLKETVDCRPGEKIYRKVLLRDGVIAGALLIGDVTDCGVLRRLIQTRRPVAGILPRLLSHGAAITQAVREGWEPGQVLPS